MKRAFPPALVAAVLLEACAHVASAPAPAFEPVAWPAPPQPPRVRLEALLPAPGRAAPAASVWRRVWNTLTGIDTREESLGLERPFGVLARPGGETVVADPDAPAVVRMSRNGELSAVTCAGRTWAAPIAVALDDDGSLLVADAGAAEIVRVGLDGSCRAFGAGQLERPTGIAARQGRIYVADPPRHEVVVLTEREGVIMRLGGHGDAPGQLSFPSGVAVEADGSVLVVDALNFRIARFGPDGRWAGSFGTRGDTDGELARPKAIAVDGGGRIYVSDAQRDAILVFLADGTFEYAIGETGEREGRFAHPAGVAVLNERLYVADSLNRRVQVFQIL